MLPPGVPWKLNAKLPAPVLFAAPDTGFDDGPTPDWAVKLKSMLLEKMAVFVAGNCGVEKTDGPCVAPITAGAFGGAPKVPKPCDDGHGATLEVLACGALEAGPPNKPRLAVWEKPDVSPNMLPLFFWITCCAEPPVDGLKGVPGWTCVVAAELGGCS